jgi:hypothetical protein
VRRTVQEVLVEVLRASGIVGIVWGEAASPYYQEAPEPPPAFPFVVLDVPPSEVEHLTEAVYVERYKPAVHVVGTREHVMAASSPYVPGSVNEFLDVLQQDVTQLDGDTFGCIRWARTSYTINLDRTARAPEGGRVWVASAIYDYEVSHGGDLSGRQIGAGTTRRGTGGAEPDHAGMDRDRPRGRSGHDEL